MVDQKNFLIPPHRKLNKEESEELLKKYGLASKQKLPKIKIKDPAISLIEDIELGDIVEISRKSFAGETKYYRVVIE